MNTSGKYCKNCKGPYKDHIGFILDEWPNDDSATIFNNQLDKILAIKCNRFQLMTNLEFLEWKLDEAENKI